jgi:hypothetical protein
VVFGQRCHVTIRGHSGSRVAVYALPLAATIELTSRRARVCASSRVA